MSNFKLIPNRFSGDADVTQTIKIVVDGKEEVAELGKNLEKAADAVEDFAKAEESANNVQFVDMFKTLSKELGSELTKFTNLSNSVKLTTSEMNKMADLKAKLFVKGKEGFFSDESKVNGSSVMALYKMKADVQKVNADLDTRALENAKQLYEEEMKRYEAVRAARREKAEALKEEEAAKSKQDPLASLKNAMSGNVSFLDAAKSGKQSAFGVNPESIESAKQKLEAQVEVMQRIRAIRNEAAQAAANEVKETNAVNKALRDKMSLLKESVAKQVASGANINPLTGASNDRNMSDISVDTDLANFSQQLKEQLESQVTVWDKLKQKIMDARSSYKSATSSINENSNSLKNNKNNAESSAKSFSTLMGKLKQTAVSYRIMTGFFKSIGNGFLNLYKSAADYEESLNLYRASLGDFAEEGEAWANKISDALYLDPTNVLQYTGAFYNLVNGLGVGSKAAYLMATNLTQLSYDMSSFLNIDVDTAYEKVTSAITGQSRAVVTAGVAMQQASLQETATELGIKKKVATMTQAEKTYLRYIQIMNSTKKMQGDLARTIITPANALRVMQTQFQQLGRAIGQVFIPIVMKAVPYVIALTTVLKRLASSLGEMMGYQVADIDYSKFKSGTNALKDMGDEADSTSGKINRTLAAFDDLNVVESSSSGTGSGSGGSVLSQLEEYITGYDMLEDLNKSLSEQAKGLEGKMLKLVKIAGVLFGVLSAYKTIKGITKIVNSVAGTASSIGKIMGFFNIGKKASGANNIKEALEGTTSVGTSATKASKSINLPSWKTLGKGLAQLAVVVTAVIAYVEILGLLCRIPGFKKNIKTGTWAMKEVFFGLAAVAIPIAAAAYGVTLLAKVKVSDFAKGFANFAIIVGGTTALVEALGLLALIPGNLVSGGTEAVKTVFGGLGEVALPIAACAIAMTALSNINWKTMLTGFADFAIVVGGTVALVEVIGALAKIPGDLVTSGIDAVKKVFNGLAEVALPLVAVSAAFMLAGLMGGSGAAAIAIGLADFAIVVAGTTAVMLAIGAVMSISGFKTFLSGGIEAMQQVFNGIASVALPLVAVSAAFALAGLLGGAGAAAFAIGLADFAIVVGGTIAVMTAIGAVLSLGELKSFLSGGIEAMTSMFNGLYSIAVPLGLFTGYLVVLGLATPAVILSGLAGFALVLGGLTLVLAAMGALNQIPGFSWIISEGGTVFMQLGEIIGGFAGSIIAGFAGKIMDGLPKIGKDLADFMTNANPFFENAGKIDEKTTKGIKNLATAMLAITAAEILDSLTKWLTGGNSLAKFGSDLAAFGPKFASFADSVKNVDGAVVEKSAKAAQSICEFAKNIPNEGGIASWFAGDNTIDKIGNKLPAFGKNLASYYKEVKDIKSEVVEKSANAAKAICEFAKNVPNEGGVASWFAGDNTIDKIGNKLPKFGENLMKYAKHVEGLDSEVVTNSATAAQAIVAFAENIPNSGGVVSWFTGDNSLADFGEDLADFGGEFKNYYNSIKGINTGTVNAVSEAVSTLVSNLKTIKDKGLNSTLTDFGKSLSKGADGIDDFFKQSFSAKTAQELGQKFGENLGSKMKSALKSKIGSTLELSTGKSDTAATYKIKMYESGGYPTSGELFFANENGNAEFISKIGNKTAVANQDQMVQALTNAILAGFSSLNSGSGTTNVYIGNKKVYEGQGTYQNRQSDRYGTNYVKI